MNGPPLVVYGSLRRWSAAHFRATLQAYFLPASVIGMAGYWMAGLWVPLVTRYYLLSLPGTLVATLLGRVIHRRMHERDFIRYVYVGLLVLGSRSSDSRSGSDVGATVPIACGAALRASRQARRGVRCQRHRSQMESGRVIRRGRSDIINQQVDIQPAPGHVQPDGG
jgi:hypothetical protein